MNDVSKSDERKIKQQEMTKARTSVGSIKRSERNIDITDREWEAIQAGAVSDNILTRILNNADMTRLRIWQHLRQESR